MENLNFSLSDEIIDLEWCFRNGHKPPKGRRYGFLVDRKPYVSPKECMTGAEILEFVGKTPHTNFQLRQKFRGSFKTIEYDQEVCFSEPGIERFKTIPLDQTEGEGPRRAFSLLEEDIEFLDSLDLPWETIVEGNNQWLLIHDYPIPEGFTVTHVTIAVLISPGYPTSPLDMLYFNPAIQRVDGQPIGALSNQRIDNRDFQRWSRHRSGANPWRPGVDNLSTHVPLADAWLVQEFQKRKPHGIPA